MWQLSPVALQKRVQDAGLVDTEQRSQILGLVQLRGVGLQTSHRFSPGFFVPYPTSTTMHAQTACIHTLTHTCACHCSVLSFESYVTKDQHTGEVTVPLLDLSIFLTFVPTGVLDALPCEADVSKTGHASCGGFCWGTCPCHDPWRETLDKPCDTQG